MPHEAAPAGRRDAESVLRTLLDDGTGCCGPERTAAVAHLAAALGALPRWLAGTRRTAKGEVPHAALLFETPAGPALCDPAFPLPGLVPLARETKSPWGTLHLRCEGERWRLVIDGRGRRTEALALAPADEAALAAVPDPPAGSHLRLLDDRVVAWRDGLLTVVDPWSRLVHPFADADAFERLFGVAPSAPLSARPGAARLAVYDHVALPAGELLARVATPAGLRALGAPGLEVAGESPTAEGWRWTLRGPGIEIAERVARLPDGLRVASEGGPFAERRYAVEPDAEGTRLALRATLATVPPRGFAEPMRKTLVFHLVAELLAWQAG